MCSGFFSMPTVAVVLDPLMALSSAAAALAGFDGPMQDYFLPWLIAAAAACGLAMGAAFVMWRRNVRLAARLQRLHEQLDEREAVELELKQAQAKLETALQSANSANEVKRLFLAHMSHELRTPLNGIIGMTDILRETDLNNEQIDFANTIMGSSDSLLHLINDILDYANLEASKLKLETADFDLAESMREVVRYIEPMAHEKQLGFTHIIDDDVPVHLIGDARRLKQVIINLLSNAVKFTHTGGIVLHASLASEKRDDCMLRITVRDTGIGIAPDRLDRLFGSFSQVDPGYTRKYGGIGLGLSLAQSLVELMHGEIKVESEPDKGSVFWFTVRLKIQERLPRRVLSMEAGDIIGKRILVVDDHQANRQVLRENLKKWQFASETVSDAPAALAMLHRAVEEKNPFHLAVIDHFMPEMDGVDLGRAIKKDPLLEQTRMVMLTSREQQEDMTPIRAAGYDAYLTRPIQASQLFDCLMLVLAKAPCPAASPDAPTAMVTREDVRKARDGKPRILVVEDNRINQQVMEKILSMRGCRCRIAGNGREAVEELRVRTYDVVLMDLQMPEMNGFEATSAIRNPVNKCLDPHVPIIAVTANAGSGDREKCLDAGMDDYLPKPVLPNPLMEKIKQWCEARRMDESGVDRSLPN